RIVVEQLVVGVDRPVLYGDDAVGERTWRDQQPARIESDLDAASREWVVEIELVDRQELEQHLTKHDEIQAGQKGLAIDSGRKVAQIVIFELIERVGAAAVE